MTIRHAELKYNHKEIDTKWRTRWEESKLYYIEDDASRSKWYELTMYPYTSGDLHIGHWYAIAPYDAHVRFQKMRGLNVLAPIGFDAFGLPAENAAIKRGIHPHTWTMDNIENMRRQLKSMGTAFDWTKEVVTCLPEYYRWNQWFFLQMYEHDLAYRANAPVNWCPSCQTVLANEQVMNGYCERCDTGVTRRDLKQWFFRITKYAEELLDFSGLVDWPEKILIMQRNWIGHSEGVDINFDISHYALKQKEIITFTTRIDTIFGVTFMVLAPEHHLVEQLTMPDRRKEVQEYVERARRQTEVERLSTEHEKTGVFLGSYAVNRLNGEKVPIFIADYAILGYGTGAVMSVPAHDHRDFEFAKKYKLPIKVVISPTGWKNQELTEAYVEEGVIVNSGKFDGMPSEESKQGIADFIETQGWGKRAVSYRIRDWLISRQRYWGTPIPMIYCSKCGTVPVPEGDLPVLLPPDAEFKPTGESPLARHQDFVRTTCPNCHERAHRETDTMDMFMDSSWYFLRYISPKYSQGPFDPEKVAKWMPVDQYTGGAEHAVMHLLYARFFTKALRDMGLVNFGEPFLRLFNQGTIEASGAKMSKSRGNVINPDSYVEEMGADVVRTYLMFLGPWDQGGEWSDSGINGVARWLNRVWELCQRDGGELPKIAKNEMELKNTLKVLHQTIRKVVQDLERFKFNTAIAAMMEFSNHLNRVWTNKSVDGFNWQQCIERLLLMLAPFAPHLAEELWERTGRQFSIHQRSFPTWDESLAAEEIITLVVQVDGKVRDQVKVPADISKEDAEGLVLKRRKVVDHLRTRRIQRIVYVPGRLVNLVTE